MWGFQTRPMHDEPLVLNEQPYDGPCPEGHAATWTSTQYEPPNSSDHRGEFNRDYTLATFECPTCDAVCHCGRPVHIYDDLDGFTRGMCYECSTVRCDLGGGCPS